MANFSQQQLKIISSLILKITKSYYYCTLSVVPPMLTIPNQLEAAYVGQDVALECHTEAYPTSINYWTTERGDMIVSGIYLIFLRYNERNF